MIVNNRGGYAYLKEYRERKVADGLCVEGGCRRKPFRSLRCRKHREIARLAASRYYYAKKENA